LVLAERSGERQPSIGFGVAQPGEPQESNQFTRRVVTDELFATGETAGKEDDCHHLIY
jgi:hypothetical protein